MVGVPLAGTLGWSLDTYGYLAVRLFSDIMYLDTMLPA
jgi:hypothetical protein